MLLNILECKGQIPTTKNYLIQSASIAEVEKHCSRERTGGNEA